MAISPAIFQASLRTLRPLAAGLSARGVEVARVLREAGVDPAWLEDPDARVPASVVHELWRRTEEVTGDPNFGLRTALGIRPGSFDVLDYVCRNCPSVEHGFALYCRFTPLLHDGIDARLIRGPDTVSLRHVLRDGTVLPRQYAEFILGSLIVIARQATGHQVVPTRVRFLHPPPRDLSLHREFFRCPLTFRADSNGFELRRADVARPLLNAQPGLLVVLEQHAEHLLAKSPRRDTFVAQVRAAILGELRTGSISAAAVAKRLGTSPRTLRRRLDADGTTYQKQLADLRRELALRYMREKHLSIDEVALLLGFSERTAFIRAFRRWTGHSPTAFRQHAAVDRA
jgi:AraC-like DNA-binding protein